MSDERRESISPGQEAPKTGGARLSRAGIWNRIAGLWASLTTPGRDRIVRILDEYGIGDRDLTDAEAAQASDMLVAAVKGDPRGGTLPERDGFHLCPAFALLSILNARTPVTPALRVICRSETGLWYAGDAGPDGDEEGTATRVFFCPFCGKDLDR